MTYNIKSTARGADEVVEFIREVSPDTVDQFFTLNSSESIVPLK